MKLRGKLILTFVVILLIFSLAVFGMTYVSMESFFAEQVKEEVQELNRVCLSFLDYKYPGQWRVEGDSLYKGDTLMNDNLEFIDEMGLQEGTIITLFMHDTRVLTNLTDENGERMVGTKASPQIVEQVLNKGKPLTEELLVLNVPSIASFTPIRDADNQVVGTYCVARSKQDLLDEISSLKVRVGRFQVGAIIVAVIVIWIVGTRLSDPLKAVTQNLIKISEGKLNTQIPDTKLKDEVGDIVKASQKMQQSVRGMIQALVTESVNIENALSLSVNSMDELKGSMEEASSTTEQLSSGMQETAASMEEMNATSSEIGAAVDHMAQKAQEGRKGAEEIKERASLLKQRAAHSKNTAMELLTQSQKELKEAIDKSKAIEQIQVLTQSILQITSQTNLLALNAAIEAS